jgi:hypothetical protein
MIKTEAYNECTQFLGLTTKNGFKAGKLYTQKPLSAADAFVVNRNLAAYRINQSGVLELMAANVPRVDYKNGCPEILIENEATNRLIRSEEFNTTAWSNRFGLSISANAINAPNDTLTADRVIENSANSDHYFNQEVSVTTGTTYTMSLFIKNNGRRYCYLFDGYTGNGRFFDIQEGLVLGNFIGSSVGNIESLSNGWYRISVTVTSSGSLMSFYFGLSNNGTSLVYTGDGTSGFYIWGAQLEQSSFATSYIPTTTTSLTRPPDIIENNTINYDINQATIFVRARLDFSTDVRGVITLYDGGPFESYITIYSEIIGGVRKIVFQTYTDPDDNIYQLTVPSNGIYNMAFAYDLTANTYAIAVNGNIEFSGTFGNNTPTSSELNTLTLGRIGSFYDARVIGLMFFDSKLDNTSLENLTA